MRDADESLSICQRDRCHRDDDEGLALFLFLFALLRLVGEVLLLAFCAIGFCLAGDVYNECLGIGIGWF